VQVAFRAGTFAAADYVDVEAFVKVDVANSSTAVDGSYGVHWAVRQWGQRRMAAGAGLRHSGRERGLAAYSRFTVGNSRPNL